ncbi:MAG: hypothetical protein ACXU9X_13160, partial [Thermodesulfobacteriota bacterium]
MEDWNDGILERVHKIYIRTYYSIIPTFHYSISLTMHEVCVDLRPVLHEVIDSNIPILSRETLAEDL